VVLGATLLLCEWGMDGDGVDEMRLHSLGQLAFRRDT
jgi:hypothetical protein